MTKVRSALGADHFDPVEAVGGILEEKDSSLVDDVVEGGPTRMGVVLRSGCEKLLAADDAAVRARLLVLDEFPREGAFGSFLLRDAKLRRREALLQRRLLLEVHSLWEFDFGPFFAERLEPFKSLAVIGAHCDSQE